MLKLDPTNTELVTQKQKILAQNIEETSEKLKLLKETQQKADEAIANGTEVSDENYRNLQRDIINTENKLKNLKVEASNWTTAGRAIEEYGNKIQSLGKKIDSIGNKLTAGLTLPILAIGVAGVQSAATQEAAMQQVEKIYGDAADTVKNFAENTALSFNMSTSDAYKYAQIYGNLIQSITDDQEENAKYTQELLEASSIIASATGRTMEDVMDRIRSGLLGNTEAIEDLGVNVNVAMIESTDAFKKFAGDKSWLQLDFQTQQQIRLFAILEQTTKKYGKEVNKNTSSDIQRLTARFKNLTSDLSKKLLPIANKLIDKAEDFLESLEDLDDEQIDNIINIGLMVAAIGPLVKVLGATTSVIGGVTKGIGLFSQAIGVAAGKTVSETASVNKLANAFKFLTSPMGLATTALGLLVAGLVVAIQKHNEYAFDLSETSDKLKEAKQSQDEFNQSLNDSFNSQMSEIKNVETLADELETLVDKNGKVKKGYEGRVNFILNELNEALGTEYRLNGNLVESYDKIVDSIDELIQKKRAEIILSNEEEKYNEAIEKKSEAYNNLKQAQDELTEANNKYLEAIKNNDEQAQWVWKAQVDRAQQNVSSAQSIYQTYLNDIANYESDYETIMTGSNEEIEKLINSRTYTYQSASGDLGETINHNIQQVQSEIEYYKQAYQQDLVNQNEYSAQKNQAQKEAAEKQLQTLAEELKSMTSTTEELTPQQIEAWKNLATNSYDIYKETLKNMDSTVAKEIEEATGVLANDRNLVKESGNLASKARNKFKEESKGEETGENYVSELAKGADDSRVKNELFESVRNTGEETSTTFNNSAKGEDSGKNFVSGLKNGISSASGGLFSAVWDLGKRLVSSLNGSLDEHSPSKLTEESGTNFVQGAINGITSKEREALNLVNKFGSNLINKFNAGFNDSTWNANMANAKLNSKVIDSTKTIFTTPTLNIYTQGEVNIRKIADEVNRIFGSQY